MPPSPAMRCSPCRELSVERNHKRERSFEIGSPVGNGDDDLALFNDMQVRERDNFLLHSSEDFEDSLSTLKFFPDFKLNIPVRRVSSDLMNVEGEKNDYDWLLTPPDTPLFPSLDDDEPIPVNLLSGSRPPSHPITISGSSMTEKGYRTSRRSVSPHRLSPSPRSGSSTPQLDGRASYAPHSSPNPVSRPTQPSRRSASPASKPSTSTPRSSTPTLQRMSTGSSGNMSSSARKGASPVKASRGNSTSPKLRGWQSSLPGFSSDAPSNLRTSFSDRTASHSRGSSPAYRNRGDSPLRSGRQSLSPTASRSVSSSCSHGRDQRSSHGKSSTVSCGDDDVDSLYSDKTGISASTTLGRNRVFANNRNMILSKKPSRAPSSSSAPKRSFDSIIKQMDQHKSPQNMFRPLLSSVPTSTFYAGRANTIHHPIFSRNSSLTTSSNASSELGASVVLGMGGEHDQSDIAGEWEKMLDADVQEEIFTFDRMDEVVDIANELGTGKPQSIHCSFGGSIEITKFEEHELLTSGFADIAGTLPTSGSLYNVGDQYHHSEVDFVEILVVCSMCGKSFQVPESLNENADFCQQCAEKDESTSCGACAPALSEIMAHASHSPRHHPTMDVMVDEKTQIEFVPEVVDETKSRSVVGECQNHAYKHSDFLAGICPGNMVTSEMQQHLLAKELECRPEVVSTSYNKDTPEGAGISVLLLKSSNSGKGPIMQGRSLAAANVFRAKSLYIRDNVNASKISITRNSSASSSVDLGSARELQAGAQQQLSSSKADPGMDLLRSEPSLSCQRTEACTDGTSSRLYEGQTKLPYRGDSLNDLKGCVILESASSSCVDLVTSRQTEGSIQRQQASSECVIIDHNLKAQSTQISLSGVSCNSQYDLSPTCWGRSQEKVSGSVETPLIDTQGEFQLVTEEHANSMEETESCGARSSPTRTFLSMGDEVGYGESCRILDSSALLNETQNTLLKNVSSSDVLNGECHASSAYSETHLSQDGSDAEDMATKISDSCPFEEDDLINNSPCRTGISESFSQISSCTTAALQDGLDILEGQLTENEAHQSIRDIVESSNAHSISSVLEDNLISSLDDNTDHAHDNHGELAITVEGPGGTKSRCLTLEQATDTILFCSNIIHDLAFKAAAIGMEKEQSSPKGTNQPIAITFGKSAFDEKYQKKTPPKRTIKPPQARRMTEMDASIPVAEPENTEITKFPSQNTSDLPDKVGSLKPMKLESKCNCTVM